ncbi:hypothetical protein EON65_22000 [archaeon]|nr:MAG: hypothetical protein EON65_22000 [archaeon]
MYYGKEDQIYYAGTTTAMPVPPPATSPNNNVNVGQVVYVSSAAPTNAAVPGEAPRRPRPDNRWADNICDWPANLYPSCYCATCVCWGMWINAQSKSYHIMRMCITAYWCYSYHFLLCV